MLLLAGCGDVAPGAPFAFDVDGVSFYADDTVLLHLTPDMASEVWLALGHSREADPAEEQDIRRVERAIKPLLYEKFCRDVGIAFLPPS